MSCKEEKNLGLLSFLASLFEVQFSLQIVKYFLLVSIRNLSAVYSGRLSDYRTSEMVTSQELKAEQLKERDFFFIRCS